MHTLRTLLLGLIFFLAGHAATAQDFGSAIGLRFGYPLSVSYKNFLDQSSAVEVYAGLRGWGNYRWFSINGAYQVHNDITEVYGLQWYYGGGLGVQFWSYDFVEESSTTLSLSGYLGLQYTFADTPVTFSLDWVPTVFIGKTLGNGFNRFGAGYGALAARYILFR